MGLSRLFFWAIPWGAVISVSSDPTFSEQMTQAILTASQTSNARASQVLGSLNLRGEDRCRTRQRGGHRGNVQGAPDGEGQCTPLKDYQGICRDPSSYDWGIPSLASFVSTACQVCLPRQVTPPDYHARCPAIAWFDPASGDCVFPSWFSPKSADVVLKNQRLDLRLGPKKKQAMSTPEGIGGWQYPRMACDPLTYGLHVGHPQYVRKVETQASYESAIYCPQSYHFDLETFACVPAFQGYFAEKCRVLNAERLANRPQLAEECQLRYVCRSEFPRTKELLGSLVV